MKNILLSLAVSVLFSLIGYTNFIDYKTAAKSDEDIEVISTINIAVVGDLMCHSVQYNYAHVAGDSFNFIPVYRYVKKYLDNADFTFGNLETVLAGREAGYSGYPFFNSPDDYAVALKETGFDLLTTANNHSLDKGEKGIRRTIKILNELGIGYNGTYVSEKDRDSIRIYNINGIKIAFLAYTYGTNGIPIPKGKDYLINLIDYALIERDIKKARENAELVLVHYHFGEEYKREPVQSQITAVNKAVEFGADIIIGGHPHVIQPVKYFKTNNARLDSGFIAYSLGNFFSNQQWRYSDAGVILNLTITKNFSTDSIYIRHVSSLPTWVFKGSTENGREYLILPSELGIIDTSISFLSSSDKNKMREAFLDTEEILTRYTKNIKMLKLN